MVEIQEKPEKVSVEEECRLGLGVYSDEELLNYKPEHLPWLIENVVPKAEIGLLVGKRGQYKTWVALYLGVCLAAGMKVFGIENVPETKKVLYIDEENGKSEIAKRVGLIKKGLGITTPLRINFISFAGVKLDVQENGAFLSSQAMLDKFIDIWRPDLIIVDCFQRAVHLDVDKDNREISVFLREVIREKIQNYGHTWLFIHHLRKSLSGGSRFEDPLDEIRGGSELTNIPRFVLSCEEPRNKAGEVTKLKFCVRRLSIAARPEDKVLSLVFDDEKLVIEYIGLPEKVLRAEVQAAEAIKQFLFNQQITGIFQTKLIMDNADTIGFGKTILQDGLRGLADEGFLDKPKRGEWRIATDSGEQKKLPKEVEEKYPDGIEEHPNVKRDKGRRGGSSA